MKVSRATTTVSMILEHAQRDSRMIINKTISQNGGQGQTHLILLATLIIIMTTLVTSIALSMWLFLIATLKPGTSTENF